MAATNSLRNTAASLMTLAVACTLIGTCSSSQPGRDTPAWADAGIAAQVRGNRPVIFLGLDGADWTLLDQYISRGLMPNLQRLAAGGASGQVETIQPALSPLIWTTMVTGMDPLDHGILDFVQFNPVTGDKEPIGSTQRRVPAIWNMANMAGRTAAVFGLWATYPAEPVRGLMVSDRLFSFLFKEETPPPHVVHPADQEGWAREGLARAESAVDYRAVRAYLPWLTEAEYVRVSDAGTPYDNPISALRRILIETRVYRDLSLEWIRRERPDLAVVYFQGTDTIGHMFAPYVPPKQPEVDAADFERYSGVAERYFHEFDTVIGEYAALAAETGAVLVLASDHGFLWGEGRPTTLSSVATATAAKWHAPKGIYVVSGPSIAATGRRGVDGNAAHVEQVCATLLALMGLPPGRDVNGDPLPGVSPTGAARVDYFALFHPVAQSLADARSGVSTDALANLRSLGYIGSGESTSAPGSARGSTRSPGSYNNEGVIRQGQGKLPQAIEAFERALALDPGLVSAQWNLSDVLYAQGQSLDRSDALLQQAYRGGLPDGNRYLIGRAIAYQRNGQVPRSLKLIEAALEVQPDDVELWLFRGRYRVEASECRGAERDFARAAQLAPDNPAAYASLGLARMCLGNEAGAREAFQRSLRLDPAQPNVRDFLARIGG